MSFRRLFLRGSWLAAFTPWVLSLGIQELSAAGLCQLVEPLPCPSLWVPTAHMPLWSSNGPGLPLFICENLFCHLVSVPNICAQQELSTNPFA